MAEPEICRLCVCGIWPDKKIHMLELLLVLTLRAVRGFCCALPGICIWFLWRKVRKRPQPAEHLAGAMAFCFYLSGVLAVTGIGKPFGFSPRLALVPFVDMIKGPVDTTLNILLFLPVGVFLPRLYAEFKNMRRIALAAFCLSLAIECTQMFGLGITDVNDLMTNTAGACLGFLLAQKRKRRMQTGEKKKLQAADTAWAEILWLTASLFASVMFFAPAWLR